LEIYSLFSQHLI